MPSSPTTTLPPVTASPPQHHDGTSPLASDGSAPRTRRRGEPVRGRHHGDRRPALRSSGVGRLVSVGAAHPSRRHPDCRSPLPAHGSGRHGRLSSRSHARRLPCGPSSGHRAHGGRLTELPRRRHRLGRHPPPPPRLRPPHRRPAPLVPLWQTFARPVARPAARPRGPAFRNAHPCPPPLPRIPGAVCPYPRSAVRGGLDDRRHMAVLRDPPAVGGTCASRCPTVSPGASTPPATRSASSSSVPGATTGPPICGRWPCAPSARAGTTFTTPTPPAPGTGSTAAGSTRRPPPSASSNASAGCTTCAGRRRSGARPVVSDIHHPITQGSWQEPS
jgi:hypothetical protein